MPERRPSLRRRLLVLLLATTGVVWIAVAIATFMDARHHARELFDAQLEEYVEVLSALAAHEAHELEGEMTEHEHRYAQHLSYQVFSDAGQLLMRSHAAPDAALAERDGFTEVVLAGDRWRALRRAVPEEKLVLIVASRLVEREAHVREVALGVLVPLVLGLPLLGAAIWIGVSRAMEPLARIAAEVHGREPDRLEPIATSNAPKEVVPLLDALNALFARVERTFENERRFTGDAAHELRTPLAALRTQAELALTTGDDKRRHALEQVVAGVERATRLVEGLLALARLDAGAPRAFEPVDLLEIAREVSEDLAPEARGRGIEARGEGGLTVRGDRSMLHALARNLAENALRHAGEPGTVRLSAARREGAAELRVEDSGPGVPPELRDRIFDRFFRIEDGREEGSGLGLSIARRVVELHGGTIRAGESRELGGLAVTVTLPLHEGAAGVSGRKDPLRRGA